MLSILSGVLGFATSGLPRVLEFFQQKGDQKHELAMAKLDMERSLAMAEKGFASQERIEEFKTEQVSMETYAQERTALYDHDKKLQEGASPWVRNLSASVRPVVTYVFIFIILFVDIAGMVWAINTGVDFEKAMNILYDDNDVQIFASRIGFWFGSRVWEKRK